MENADKKLKLIGTSQRKSEGTRTHSADGGGETGIKTDELGPVWAGGRKKRTGKGSTQVM